MEFNYKNIIKEKNKRIKNILNICDRKDKEIERLKIDYQQANDIIVEQQKEIEQLNKELETIKDNFDFNLGAIENIRKENHSLEERIDKAIEYIENDLSHATSNGKLHRKHLLNILKGVDKE